MILTHGSLFAGIGGFDLGFHKAGIKTLWRVEIDKKCNAVAKMRYPDVKTYEDIRLCRVIGTDERKQKSDRNELDPVSIITFGSPCQDLSIAGKRTGLNGQRSSLFWQAIRIIKEMREATASRYPRLAIWENVPNSLSVGGGRDFHSVLQALADCGAMEIGWRVLNAQYFGVAQRRRRVFVIADFGGHAASKILFESKSMFGDFKEIGEEGYQVAKAITTSTQRREPTTDTFIYSGESIPSSGSAITRQVCSTLRASGAGTSRPGMASDYKLLVSQKTHPARMREADGISGRFHMHLCKCPDSPRYRTLGNAVVVPVAYWLGKRIQNELGLLVEEK